MSVLVCISFLELELGDDHTTATQLKETQENRCYGEAPRLSR